MISTFVNDTPGRFSPHRPLLPALARSWTLTPSPSRACCRALGSSRSWFRSRNAQSPPVTHPSSSSLSRITVAFPDALSKAASEHELVRSTRSPGFAKSGKSESHPWPNSIILYFDLLVDLQHMQLQSLQLGVDLAGRTPSASCGLEALPPRLLAAQLCAPASTARTPSPPARRDRPWRPAPAPSCPSREFVVL